MKIRDTSRSYMGYRHAAAHDDKFFPPIHGASYEETNWDGIFSRQVKEPFKDRVKRPAL